MAITRPAYQEKVGTTLVPTGTTQEIDWSTGAAQVIDLDSATGDVTISFSNAVENTSYLIKVIQGTTARELVFPVAVKFPDGVSPTITITDDAVDIISLWYDGTSYYGSYIQDLS